MRAKRKSNSHLIEKKSLAIVNSIIPDYWTIREYIPDYGIDLDIELFESKIINDKRVYDTLGEHLFIQVKGTENIDFSQYTIHERKNVELYKEQGEPYKTIDIIKFQIDTAELYTVERMSSAVPVLLFIVDVHNNDIYFLCLNDYIEKVLIPSDPNYYEKKTKTIYIPRKNLLNSDEKSLLPLMWYAKRPKLYSFFNKVNYQVNEIGYMDEDKLLEVYPHLLNKILRLDIWEVREQWIIMGQYFQQLQALKERGLEAIISFDIEGREGLWQTDYSFGKAYSIEETMYFMHLRLLWNNLNSLGNQYEDIAREWFLPTYLNDLLHG